MATDIISDDSVDPKATRTKATETAYLKRALWFEGRAAEQLQRADVSPIDVAEVAIESRYGWSKANWKQIKASLVFRYTAMGTPASLEAVALLQSAQQTECLPKAASTSAQRLKAVSEEAFLAVLTKVQSSRSGYASFLYRWLSHGAAFGLRPHEWGQTQLVWMRASDAAAVQEICSAANEAPDDCLTGLPGLAWDERFDAGRSLEEAEQTKPPPQPFSFDLFGTTEEVAAAGLGTKAAKGGKGKGSRARQAGPEVPEIDSARWFLRVRNAKNTNGRAHGFFRHLDVSGCSNSTLRDVAAFAALMRAVIESGQYDGYYDSCRRLLLRINDRLGLRGKSHVQIYSPRHKFSSAVKNRFSRSEVGAMMGHANDETATTHYGKRRCGTGSSAVNPVKVEVQRVIRKAETAPQRQLGERGTGRGLRS